MNSPLVLAVSFALCAAAAAPLPGNGFLFATYDAVKGAAIKTDAVSLTYTQGKTFAHPERPSVVYSVPDQALLAQDVSQVTLDWHEASPIEWLNAHAKDIGITAQPGLLNGAEEFTEAYKAMTAQPAQGLLERRLRRGYLVASTAAGTALEAPEIQSAAKSLPSSCSTLSDLTRYKEFAQKYGTHYVSAVSFGGEAAMVSQGSLDAIASTDELIQEEITDSWTFFVKGDAFGRKFKSGASYSSDHFSSVFTLTGGDSGKEFPSMAAWDKTVADKPGIYTYKLAPLSALMGGANAHCVEAGARLYYSDSVIANNGTSFTVQTASSGQTANKLTVPTGMLVNGISLHFAGTCQNYCDADGPQISEVYVLGQSFYGFYPAQSPATETKQSVDGTPKTISVPTCSDGLYIAGIAAKYTGTCQRKCDSDGPILRQLTIECRSPHTASKATLLSEPSTATYKTVIAAQKSQSTVKASCPDGYLAENVVLHVAGTCQNTCNSDGSSIPQIDLTCRAISDFVF